MSDGAAAALVVHADWGSVPTKRFMAKAVWGGGYYVAHPPGPVGEPETLLGRLRQEAGDRASAVVGFDFPIGVPEAYAEEAGISNFLELLPVLGRGEWADFYDVARHRDEISLHRPFYPWSSGGKSMGHLLYALGMDSSHELLRNCERARPGRDAAAPLFWTMGPKQVGKAAAIGWQRVLTPALAGEKQVAIWPFDGDLTDLLASTSRTVVVETYPAEFYGHLGVNLRPGGKRSQAARRRNFPVLSRWSQEAGVVLSPDLVDVLEDGFGPSGDGEDPFDAVVGLFGILNVLLGRRDPGAPGDRRIREVEGWMLGRDSHE